MSFFPFSGHTYIYMMYLDIVKTPCHPTGVIGIHFTTGFELVPASEMIYVEKEVLCMKAQKAFTKQSTKTCSCEPCRRCDGPEKLGRERGNDGRRKQVEYLAFL